MQTQQFKVFLGKCPTITSQKAIASRLSKAKKAELILNKNLDNIVINRQTMQQALAQLKEVDNPKHNVIQNAVRKYYEYFNGSKY